MTSTTASRPVIGITADLRDGRVTVRPAYADRVVQAGGTPIILACDVRLVGHYLDLCDAFILSGGDDPITTHWGVAMHPKSKPVDPARQDFELTLLQRLADGAARNKPVLGICLGMQLMGLQAGGGLDQHLPDHLATAAIHSDGREHEVTGALGSGLVHSHHRQALCDAGSLRIVATAPDGIIEAVRCTDRPFYVGVQWHPERTADAGLGAGLFASLVRCAAG